MSATGAKAPRIENAARAFLRRFGRTDSITEWLLTSPRGEGFGVVSATPAQRAVCRILDGVPLGALAEHPDVLELLEGREAVAALPTCNPVEACFTAGVRSAKTFTACARAIAMALTVDVVGIAPGEVVRVPILSLTLAKAGESFGILSEAVSSSHVLRPLLIGEPTGTSLQLRHPSGRAVEIEVAAGKKAGGAIVGIWLAGVVFDEAPRMNGADDAVVNLEHSRAAALGRLLPGGQALYIGSPWAPHGPVYDMVQKHHGRPTARIVVMRGTGPMLNPVWWTPERCDQLRDTQPESYQTDVLGEFASPEGGLLATESVKRHTRSLPANDDFCALQLRNPHLQPGDVPRIPRGQYFAAIDPSDGTDHGNPWTLTIVERATVVVPVTTPEGEPVKTSTDAPVTRIRNRYSVVAVREWRGARPKDVIAEVATLCRAYGLNRATTDQYAGAALTDLARDVGFVLAVVPWTASRKVQAFTNLATLVAEGLVELHPDKQFQRDLLSVRKRTTQNGVAIVFPRMGDGRHCDYAPALASAIEAGSGVPGITEMPQVGTGSRWSGVSGRGFG